MVPYKLDDFLFYLKNAIGILMGIALNLYIALGNMAILTMFNLTIHEHRISFHFFVSSSLLSTLSYGFQCVGPLHFC